MQYRISAKFLILPNFGRGGGGLIYNGFAIGHSWMEHFTFSFSTN